MSDAARRAGAPPPAPGTAGLCPGCAHVRPVRSARGSLFLRCSLAARDPRFPKYPPQPVVRCSGHEPDPARPDP